MSDQLNSIDAANLLQKLLDERFKAGQEAGYAEGAEQGRTDTLHALLNIIYEMLGPPEAGPLQANRPSLADHPGDENDADPPSMSDSQPAYVQRALQYVQLHPGVTAHAARGELKNRNILYRLARLGLVEKHGPQFFPKNAEAQ